MCSLIILGDGRCLKRADFEVVRRDVTEAFVYPCVAVYCIFIVLQLVEMQFRKDYHKLSSTQTLKWAVANIQWSTPWFKKKVPICVSNVVFFYMRSLRKLLREEVGNCSNIPIAFLGFPTAIPWPLTLFCVSLFLSLWRLLSFSLLRYDNYGRLTNVTYPTGRVSSYRTDSDGAVRVQAEGSNKEDIIVTTNLSASGTFYTLMQGRLFDLCVRWCMKYL